MIKLGAQRFAIAALVAAGAIATPRSAAQAQDVLDAKSATHLFKAYENDLDTLHSKFMALANAIPADKYSWRPAPGVRSISEALLHVASEFYYWGPMSVGGKMPDEWKSAKEHIPAIEKITGKENVIAELNKSWAHFQSQLNAVDPTKLTGAYKPWGRPLDVAALEMVDDLHEHLGQMIAYARSVGVKPPWSK
jgi:uncharacterized damage-inducible protein DinB